MKEISTFFLETRVLSKALLKCIEHYSRLTQSSDIHLRNLVSATKTNQVNKRDDIDEIGAQFNVEWSVKTLEDTEHITCRTIVGVQ